MKTLIDFTVPILLTKLSLFKKKTKALTQQQQNTINEVIEYLEQQAKRSNHRRMDGSRQRLLATTKGAQR